MSRTVQDQIELLDQHVKEVVTTFEGKLSLWEGAQVLITALALTLDIADDLKDEEARELIIEGLRRVSVYAETGEVDEELPPSKVH